MVIVISPEQDVPNEMEILHQLFDAGLKYYHLRKPNKDYSAHQDYLNRIDKQYHNRIVVHAYHELINDFNLKGIHFKEQNRMDNMDAFEQYLERLHRQGIWISTSFHDTQTLSACVLNLDYYFLSPVFNSISKQGYPGLGFDVNAIDKSVIGLGGVSIENLIKLDTLGYAGAGVLGAIWTSDQPVTVFKSIKKHFEKE